jgi:hypothetical protein
VFAMLLEYNICRIGFPSLPFLGKEIDEFGMTAKDDVVNVQSAPFTELAEDVINLSLGVGHRALVAHDRYFTSTAYA